MKFTNVNAAPTEKQLESLVTRLKAWLAEQGAGEEAIRILTWPLRIVGKLLPLVGKSLLLNKEADRLLATEKIW